MKLIPLTQGYFAQVDDEDFERVSQFKWHAQKQRGRIYASRRVPLGIGRKTNQYLHRFILDAQSGELTDHADGNGLNDLKNNIRRCSPAQNCQSFKRKRKNTTSTYRGVCWKSREKRWVAEIFVAGKHIYLGGFDTAEEAARARDAKARELGWPESGMNFPL